MSSTSAPPPTSTLRDAAIADATRRAYDKNLNLFLKYTHLSLTQLLSLSSTRVDHLLSTYIDHCFATNGSYDYACQTVFGLIYRCPRLRLKLGEARLRLRGWKRLYKAKSHPPITWEITVVFSATLAKWGYHPQAIACLLAFDCYLRIGELTRLQYSDVVMPNDPRTGSAFKSMALRLAITKTGPNQWVSLRNDQVKNALLTYLRSYPFLSTSPIFPFSPNNFRYLLREVASAVGLGHVPYVPHSFRHGGATCDFLRGNTIEQIMFRGRWVSMESARRYIQTARALLMLHHVPTDVNQSGKALAPHIDRVMKLLLESVPIYRRPASGVAPRH